MLLFSFIHDIVDDHRKIADKHDEASRLAFFGRFCEWKTVGGDLRWQPRPGWGVSLRNWVRWLLKDTMKDTPFASTVIACLLTQWQENDEDDEVMGNMLDILAMDFPKGPPSNDEPEDEPDACGNCGCPWGWKNPNRGCPGCGHSKNP